MKRPPPEVLVLVACLVAGLLLLLLAPGCTLLDAATGADPAEAATARQELKAAAGTAGTILGGPLGGVLGDHLAEAAIAAYLLYRRLGQDKRYGRAVKKTVLPSVVSPAKPTP